MKHTLKAPEPTKASDDDICPPAKRSRVETTQLTHHNGQMPSKVAVNFPSSNSEREQDVDGKSTVPQKEKKWIETSGGGNYLRDEKGRINHGSIKMYGNSIDLGLGARGLKENKRTRTAVKKSQDGKYNGSHFDFSDQKRSEAELESMLMPLNFMPTAKSQSRKDSSSLLNKPLVQNASKISATSSSATPATSSQAETTLPPPAQGWGNIFKKEEGTWICLTCRSLNPKTASKCLACETPKGEDFDKKTSEEYVGNSTKEDASKGPTFCFDNKDSGNTGKFSFGAPTPAVATEKKDDTPKPTFSFGAPTPAVATEKKDDTPKPVFSFRADVPSETD